MRTQPPLQQQRVYFWVTLCLYAFASLLFTQEYFARTIEWRQATLEKMIHFDADTPFQYRILAPLVVRGVMAVSGIEAYAASKILTAVWTFCALLSFRSLLRHFFPIGLASLGALTLVYAMYWNHAALGIWRMPFDVPAIVLFNVSLLFLLQKRWAFFYAAFLLGALNRETILAVTAASILLFWRRDELPSVLRHAAYQIGIFVVIRVLLVLLFRENEGGQFHNQLAANMNNLLAGKITIPLLLAFGGLWLPAVLGIRLIDARIRRLLFLTIPFVGLMAAVGNLHELRIYNELVPLMCMAATGTGAAIFARFFPSRFQ